MKDQKWETRFQKKTAFERWFKKNDYLLHLPQALLGDEMNSIHFDWESAYADGTLEEHFRIALIDVNAATTATCSVAVRLFYQELHEYDPSWIVERFLCPVSPNNDRMLRENGFLFLSLEGRMPLDAFDVICCSQQLIGDEINLIGMLQDSGIPVMSCDRTDDDPLIIRGGASSYNPSVIMDVCDLFFFGEGEGILADLLAMIHRMKRSGKSREEILLEAVRKWNCLWAPMFYEQRFDENGKLLGMFPLHDGVPEKIKYAYVQDLDNCFILTKPVGNYCYPSKLGGGVEITRGCEGHCGFCVSGYTYMPFRVRSVDCVIRHVKEQQYYSGTEKILLSSFSGMSYPYLNKLATQIHEEEGDAFETMTLRLDSVQENPEFCAMLQRQGKRRIVFGVEGISQRLRDVTSKNCSEEQILETVRMLCRSGYAKIKFMFISGLPGESEEDREELVRLTETIMQICREEVKEGTELPVFHYSWSPLKVFPFTPFQWFEAKPQVNLLPEDTRNRLLEMGVVLTDEQPKNKLYDEKLTQLLLRGDRRLQDMLIGMAEAGIRRNGMFDSQAERFADDWIAEHDLPTYGEWFEAKDWKTVFPWDFIDTGVSRQHLWKRYLSAAGNDPNVFPRCLERCQNCGACTPKQLRKIAQYRKAKNDDCMISLKNIYPDITDDSKAEHLRYAALIYTVDEAHRTVTKYYWQDELRRTLDHAGIRFDRHEIKVYKPFNGRYDWSTGIKIAVAGLKEDIPNEELIRRLNEHTGYMRFTDVQQTDCLPKYLLSYKIPCPEGTDEKELSKRIRSIMESDSWSVRIDIMKDCHERSITADIRNHIKELSLEDHSVVMTVDLPIGPYTVYQALLDLPWEKAGQYIPVCTAFELCD